MSKGTNSTLRQAIEHLREGVQIIGFDWTYRYLNASAAAHGEREPADLIGRPITEVYAGIEHTAMFDALQRVMTTRRREVMLNEFVKPSGEHGWFDLVIDPVPEGICVLSVDVTDRHLAQLQFQQSQKMEAIGQLAGGVAHDFNNLLTAILGYCALLIQDTDVNDPRHRDLLEIRRAGENASSLTTRLLAFSRKQLIQPSELDLNATVTEMLRLLGRIVGDDVAIRPHLRPALPTILADPGQVHQVLTNLVVNARDAMPRGGEITIETSAVTLDKSYAQTHIAVVPGDYVMLAVSDTGTGMSADVQARLFEPFFTTKPAGKGTGLGLASVYGIVKQNRGNIWVYSEPGKGSTFKIYWPQAQPDSAAPRPHVAAGHGSGTGRILVVDDNATLLTLIRRVLEQRGHHVLVAQTADETLRLATEHAGTIDLLLSDVVMPQTSGPELVAAIRASNTDMKIMFMSGFTDETVVRYGLEAGAAFMQKPFTPHELADRVARLLDPPGDGV